MFVPKIPSMKMTDLAEAVAPGCQIELTGIRPGEKLHEVLVAEDEARNSIEFDDMFVITPIFQWWTSEKWPGGKPLPDSYRYTSDTNSDWFTPSQLHSIIDEGES